LKLRGEGGQATVELALALPTLAFVLALVFEVALVATDEVRLWHAAREAARAAAVDPDPGAALTAARRSGLPGIAVTISPAPGERVAGGPVTARVEYSPAARLGPAGGILSGVRMRAVATMRLEQL
jgi:Flp pilus assembly protein TadG